jgi:hypothetical protein
MKTFILITSLLSSFMVSHAQGLLPEVVPEPLTAFAKITDDYPFVLTQTSGGKNTWNSTTIYSWIASERPGYKKQKLFSQYLSNEWVKVRNEQNTFTFDDQNKLSSAVQDMAINHNGSESESRMKYTYTYNSTNKPVYILIQQAQPASSTNFSNYSNMSFVYHTQGQLQMDSTYNYATQLTVKRYYTYNANNQPEIMIELDGNTKDTISRTFYSFVNNYLFTSYTVSRNQTTNAFEPVKTDTLYRDNEGNIIKRVSYGDFIINGQRVPFLPFRNELNVYNSSKQLVETQRKTWDDNTDTWINVAKSTYSYNGNTPEIGYLYGWNTIGQTYETSPSLRILFSFQSALKEEPYNNNTQQLTVFPNPAKNSVNLLFASSTHSLQPKKYQLYNLHGQLVSAPVKEENGTTTIDISRLSPGLYTIQVWSADKVITEKLVVE